MEGFLQYFRGCLIMSRDIINNVKGYLAVIWRDFCSNADVALVKDIGSNVEDV